MKMSRTVVLMAVALTALGASASVAAPGKDTKKETNRQVMDRFFALVDSKAFDRLGEVDAADLTMVTPMGTVKGPDGHGQLTRGFAGAFPNFKHQTTRCLESGDLISCEGKFTGDNTGPMTMPDGKTMPATQKHVEFPYAGLARIKNGKVAELHVYFDMMTFMQQLGMGGPAKSAAR